MRIHCLAAGALSIGLLALSGACTLRDDSTRPNQIEGLRVLGMASEPADVVTGETTVVSALVFDEEGRDVQYQWSWCLARGKSDEGSACSIAEEDLQEAWAELETGTELPGYDLGTDESASLDIVFEPGQAITLCEILSRDNAAPDVALYTCIEDIGLSFELRVTAGSDQIVAFKEVPVLLDGDARNQNPALGPGITRTLRDGSPLAQDEPFRLEGKYKVVADVGLSESETFLPPARDGFPAPEPRGESLFLSWFVTVGATHRRGEQRTSYYEPGSVESLTENAWDMPFEFQTADAKLFLVLRDERGGTSWSEHEFTLVETP